MNASLQLQSEFTFSSPSGSGDGYARWVEVRNLALEEVVKRLQLPLGYHAEVWLRGGIRLRGRLRLRDTPMFIEEERIRDLELVVEGVPFTYAEIESCVRVD